MSKELVIAASPHETRVAVLEDGQLCEIYIEREKEFALVGSIYKGRVTRVLPGMQSAFVDIGLDSDAFLYVGDFFENLEDYDHVVTTVEGKVEKMEQQGGNVFAAPAAPAPAASAEQPPAESSYAYTGTAESPVADAANTLGNATDVDPSDPPQPSPLLPGESRGPSQPRGSFERPNNPPRSFGQGNRGPGPGFNRGEGRGEGRGDNRGDQGGRRRGGRFRRGGSSGGGRGQDRRPGRDLPPSKYASPRPYSPVPPTLRPYEPPPPNEPPSDYQPIILPGESLAKYKDRIPSAAGEPASPPSTAPANPFAPETLAGELPSSLYAPTLPAPEPPAHEEDAQDRVVLPPSDPSSEFAPEAAAAAEDVEALSDYQAQMDEPQPHGQAASAHEAHAEVHANDEHSHEEHAGADLSDEEATSLAEQLAEARHEEAAAEAAAQAAESAADDAADAAEDAADAAEDAADDAADAADAAEVAAALESVEARTGEPEDLPAMEHTVETVSEISESEPGEYQSGRQQQTPSQPASARISDPQRARFQRPMRRGGRPQHGSRRPHQDHRRPPQRRPQMISEVLKAGQEIIVQIAKEPLGKKGARITSHVALPGRFLVYMPTVNHIGVSRRIASAEERSRLRHLVTDSKGTFPGGFIVRTAAEGAPDEEIRADVEFLGRTWEKIRTQSEPRKSPALLHRDLNLVERILRDYLSNDYSAIWIDNEEEFSKVVEFVGRFQPKLVSRVKLYTKPAPIFEEFGIQQELDRALRPKVWLKSGGYIVINHTEALVAIDVNTGKYVGRGGTRLEDTIVKTNLEAVKEIVRQVRLRDLGGIIILDFIDMEERRNREKVMGALDSALRADRAPSKVLPFNEFGLVAVTRKRTKQALERVLCQPCPYCTGSGMVKSVPTICYEIQAEARKMAGDLDASSITLRVHPEIAKALKTREAGLIDELEQATRKSIIIQGDPTLHWEQYDIY